LLFTLIFAETTYIDEDPKVSRMKDLYNFYWWNAITFQNMTNLNAVFCDDSVGGQVTNGYYNSLQITPTFIGMDPSGSGFPQFVASTIPINMGIPGKQNLMDFFQQAIFPTYVKVYNLGLQFRGRVYDKVVGNNNDYWGETRFLIGTQQPDGTWEITSGVDQYNVGTTASGAACFKQFHCLETGVYLLPEDVKTVAASKNPTQTLTNLYNQKYKNVVFTQLSDDTRYNMGTLNN